MRNIANLERRAIALLKNHEPREGYYLADSGGKDSSVILELAKKSGVKFDAHYCVSPIDPPEVHQFLKRHHPETTWDYHAKGFWNMVVKKGLPTRRSRWCCEVIKEAGGLHRVVVVGSRKDESPKRRSQQGFGRHTTRDIMYVRPIVDWTKEEVWEYIRAKNVPYCQLYNEGFERLGCILCPLAQLKNRQRELERFPKVAYIWRKSCDKLVERRLSQGKDRFKTGEELWNWWWSQ